MPTPYDNADDRLMKEIISQAEKRLQAQLELAKAADQRAMTFAGFLLAGVALLAGLAFGDHPIRSQQPQLVGSAVGFLISAALAFWSARPVKWDSSGNIPSNYLEDIEMTRTLEDTFPETAVYLEDMIHSNEGVLRENGRWMSASMMVALVAGGAGLIGAGLPG